MEIERGGEKGITIRMVTNLENRERERHARNHETSQPHRNLCQSTENSAYTAISTISDK